jgi:hypothetical protein
VDDLGWPWPKHACFYSEAEPRWLSYFRGRVSRKPNGHVLLGIVVRARWAPRDALGPMRLLLAIDGREGRCCLATSGTNSAEHLLGRFVFVNLHARQLVTSNHEVRPILAMNAAPTDLGLPSDWLEYAQ